MPRVSICRNDPINNTDPLGLAWEDQYEWHHELGQKVFAGDGAFIGEALDLRLAPDVDIDSQEYGRIMRAPPHRGEGGPHIDYDKELRKKVKVFSERNPSIRVLTKKHLQEILDSLDPEFKAYNNQGVRSLVSRAQWKTAVEKRLKSRIIQVKFSTGESVRQPIKRGRLWGAVKGAGSLLRRSASLASMLLVPLQVIYEEGSALEYREALILQHQVRGEDDSTIQQRLRTRERLETYGTPAVGPTLFANPFYDESMELYLNSIPEDEIGPTELPGEGRGSIQG